MKNLKAVLQMDLKDCGVSCMQWIFKYYGGFVSLEKLREDTFTDKDGTNAYYIVNAFKKWGFDSEGILVHDILNFELKFPLIAHLVLENGLEHFIVVKYVKNDTVYIMDPGIGNTKMTIQQFNKLFTGHIIEAIPRDKIIKMDRELSINNLFFKIIKKEKFLFLKIIITSILGSFLLIICSYYLKIGSNLINKDINLLKYLILSFGIFTILKIVILYIREYYENHLNNLIDVYIYPEFLRHLFFLPSKKVKCRTTGEIVTRIEELGNIKNLFSDIFVSVFLDAILIIISIVILYIINKDLFFILLLSIIIYFLISVIISKFIYKKIIKNINYHTNFNGVITDFIDMFESIKNLNITKIILSKIENVLSKYLLHNYEFNNFFNLTNFIKNFILESAYFLINSYGFFSIIDGKMSIIDLFTFNIIISYCVDPIKNIVDMLPKFNYIKASFTKLNEFINLEEEKILSKECVMKGDIEFKNISYSYNDYNLILNNISFKIKEGSHVILNGKSGCGKSTLCKILYKENNITNGDIYVGNMNLKDLSVSTIRNNILYVSQQESLFTGTIKENILIDRDISLDKFMTICSLCEIDEIVSKKSLRYDSLIESTSQNISGGEKQRIILARGLLKDANILILDEALSEVDINLESKIIKNIRKYFKNKTIIYISHKNQNDNFENIINIGDINEIF